LMYIKKKSKMREVSTKLHLLAGALTHKKIFVCYEEIYTKF